MYLGLQFLLLLLWIFSAYLCGLLLFTKGFLLKRIVISNHSQCLDTNEGGVHPHDTKHCLPHLSPQFNKTVIVIIDALRFDFLEYKYVDKSSKSVHYQSNFQKFHQMMNNTPANFKLYKFIADPPTTTMQRLKGLTTGSLPTFVDAGSNFASYDITEDNIIHQLDSNNKKITFLGDDTWMSLFPGKFHRSFPFPSFDVKDLDTVDDGVIKHLMSEMSKGDWDVIIAHFLGVDHCGHKFGPNHPEMARKLKQMDDVLSTLMEAMDNDTILFVFGDHGMTSSGDHGGDSKDEVHAGLAVFSKRQLFAKEKENSSTFREVSQIDLVPTLSLLMGIPIPFGNLGMIIEEVFQVSHGFNASKALTYSLNYITALRANTRQVLTYIKEYSKVSEDLSCKEVTELKKLFDQAEEKFNACAGVLKANGEAGLSNPYVLNNFITLVQENQLLYKQFLSDASETYRNIWAKFDTTSIALGLSVIIPLPIIVILLLLALGADVLPHDSVLSHIDVVGFLMTVVALCFVILGKSIPEISRIAVMILQLGGLLLLLLNRFIRHLLLRLLLKAKGILLNCTVTSCNIDGLPSTMSLIFYLLSLFSNSFVVNEDSVLLFFIQSYVSLHCVINIKALLSSSVSPTEKKPERSGNRTKKKSQSNKFSQTDTSLKLVLSAVTLVCLRTTIYFRNCREEQVSCESPKFLEPFSSIASKDDNFTQVRLFLSLCSLASICFFVYFYCNKSGNLAGGQVVTICVKGILPFMASSVFISWILQVPQKGNLTKIVDFVWLHQVVFPRFAYICFINALVLLLWKPLGIFIIFRDKESLLQSLKSSDSTDSKIIHQVFQEVRKDLHNRTGSSKSQRNGEENEEKPPLIFGLGTVYSSAHIVITVCTTLLLIMLLSDGMCLSVLLLLVSGYHLCKYGRQSRANSKEVSGPHLSTIIVWSFLASYGFFSTGHQATIPSIRFEAAFIGFQGHTGTMIIPGLLIFFNTFASQIMFAISLPLLFIWNCNVSSCNSNSQSGEGDQTKNDGTAENGGELALRENPTLTRFGMFRLMAFYLAVRMLKVSTAAAVAALHRRHLMVWKIFAPRFVFEAASLLCSFPFMVFSYLFFLRVDECLRKWTNKLEEYYELKYR